MKAQLTLFPDASRIRFRCCRDITPKVVGEHHNLNVAKIPEYGNDIENRIDGQSLLADQSGRGFSDTGSSRAVIFVRRYGSS
jgi:hypothetical protein